MFKRLRNDATQSILAMFFAFSFLTTDDWPDDCGYLCIKIFTVVASLRSYTFPSFFQ